MIGRFSKLGVYQELFTSRDFYVAFAGGLLAAFSYILDDRQGYPAMTLALVSVAINGFPIIWGAIKGLIHRQINVDELVSLAIAASLMQGEFLTAAVVSFVMTLGGLIEQATTESARRAIKSLVRITPQNATLLAGNDDQKVVPVERVAMGDRILIKPGEQIPVDAVIISGVSAVDESSMTGEHMPRQVREGDSILAGTLNHNGVLRAEAVKVGQDTTLGKVIKSCSSETASTTHPPWLPPASALPWAARAQMWPWKPPISHSLMTILPGCPGWSVSRGAC